MSLRDRRVWEGDANPFPTIQWCNCTVWYKASTIRYPIPTIRYEASTIWNEASTIRYEASTIRNRTRKDSSSLAAIGWWYRRIERYIVPSWERFYFHTATAVTDQRKTILIQTSNHSTTSEVHWRISYNNNSTLRERERERSLMQVWFTRSSQFVDTYACSNVSTIQYKSIKAWIKLW